MTTRRELQKQQTRQRILVAAIDQFAEFGFDAASLGEIAKSAHVTKALVQYHFETKEKLWQAAVDQLWAELYESFPAELATVNAARGDNYMRDICRVIVSYYRSHPAWIKILFKEATSDSPRTQWFVDRHMRKVLVDGVRSVELAQQKNLLPGVDPLHLLHILSGALAYTLTIARLTELATGEDFSSEAATEKLIDTMVTLIGRR